MNLKTELQSAYSNTDTLRECYMARCQIVKKYVQRVDKNAEFRNNFRDNENFKTFGLEILTVKLCNNTVKLLKPLGAEFGQDVLGHVIYVPLAKLRDGSIAI